MKSLMHGFEAFVGCSLDVCGGLVRVSSCGAFRFPGNSDRVCGVRGQPRTVLRRSLGPAPSVFCRGGVCCRLLGGVVSLLFVRV